MVLRKQTVWLLTMLAVMVVLSGYYLVKGPQEQVPAVSGENQAVGELDNVSIETKEAGQEQTLQLPTLPSPTEGAEASANPVDPANTTDPAAEAANTPADKPVAEKTDAATLADSPSDVFQGYKMNRDTLIEKEKDEQMNIMMNPEASPQAVAEAKARHEELSTWQQNSLAVEQMLVASGYKDAVVTIQKDKVTVVVEKDKLTAEEVVNIIAQVKQQINVPGKNVTVQYKAL